MATSSAAALAGAESPAPPVGVHQLQVAARQALVGAVDEDQLLAHQLLGAALRDRAVNTRITSVAAVWAAPLRAVEQLVAHHDLLRVHDGLARNHGDRRLVARWGRGQCANGESWVMGVGWVFLK